MINFTVITDTPQKLAQFLESRGIIELADDGQGGTAYQGVHPGLEWRQVPNPIVIDPGSGTVGEPGYVPPTYDSRHVFLVKFSRESEAEDADGPTLDEDGNPINQFDRTKFGKWAMLNTTQQAAPAGWTLQGQPVGNVRKVNGQNVWLVRDNPERFGVWQ